MRHGAAGFGQHGVETLGLRDGARKPVQEKPGLGVALRETLANDTDHDLIGHKRTGLHVLLRRKPHLCARGDRGTQHVARGDVRQREAGADAFGLRTLAGAAERREE